MNMLAERNKLVIESPSGPFELAYRLLGSGPPVLFLHGFFGHGDDWDHLPSLQEGVCAIRPDLPGHGASLSSTDTFSFHGAAHAVLQLLEALQVRSCRAVGLSGGALTLLRMAVVRPELFTGIVLVSATDRFADSTRVAMKSLLADLRRGSHGLARSHPREGQVERLFAAAARFADGHDDAALSAAELAKVRARALIVAGERDPLYPLDAAQRLTRALGDAELWVVPDEGHTPVFGAARAEFLERARRVLALA